MPTRYTRETFFRPDEVERQAWSITADVYNRCQLLLSRSETGCVFVPIRNMQYVAVIDAEEIIFVDSQRQLVSEFAAALRQLEQKYRDAAIPACGAAILPLKQSKNG